ncbi:rod shape-determining protein MreD [Metallumcola ferriviriculae]|uniref:Rod shape-determining protein MreD n=1 Tax=Metallumcola ferriviriculae TaxID=3039180 RepID=A0AAU0UIU3_9FIRM|nr:rod shape-determining protein MreD [Desulfitibacteraceae bacterium MK1]
MRILGLALLLLISLVLESTVLEQWRVFNVTPDLVLVWVIILTLLWGRRRGAIVGFIFGLVEDLFFAKYVGTNALIKMVVALFIGSVEEKLFKENIFVPVLAAFLGSIMYQFGIMILELYLGRMLKFDLRTLFGFSIYNGIIALVVYRGFYRSCSLGWLKIPERWREISG